MPPSFDRLKSFGHDELIAKHCYFRPPDVDGIKIFDKDDQATKHCSVILMFCGLVIFIPSKSGGLEHLKKTMFCSEVIITKTFKPIKTIVRSLHINMKPIKCHRR